MTLTHFYLAIVIGTVLSLIVDEVFGIQCGGYIVPGYLAMVCDDIACVLIVFALSLITYLIINYVLPKFMILFGKRKFASVTFRGVGAITPSLLANSYSRQGIIYTIPATLIVTYITFGLVNLLSIYI